MHRDDAATVSYTEVTVSAHEAVMRYHACAPCESTSDSVHCLRVETAKAEQATKAR